MLLMVPGSCTTSVDSVSCSAPALPSVALPLDSWAACRAARQLRSLPSIDPVKNTLPPRMEPSALTHRERPIDVEARGFLEELDHKCIAPSSSPDTKRSVSITDTAHTGYRCLLKYKCVSLSTFHKRTLLSAPPVR